MACTSFFETLLKSCPSSITLKAGLAAATEYYWLLTTRHGKLYQRKATTDAQGILSLDASLLPAGMLNPNAGAFFLEVRQGANYLQKVSLSIEGGTYEGVMMNFKDVEGEVAINNQIPVSAW